MAYAESTNAYQAPPPSRPNGQIKQRSLETRDALLRIINSLDEILDRTRGSVPSPSAASVAQIDPDHVTFLLQGNLVAAERIEQMVKEIQEFI